MPDLLAGVPTTYLDLDGYLADYERAAAALDGTIWKAERAQVFQEPENPSWEAFRAGDWATAIALAEQGSTELTAYFDDLHASGFGLCRVRIVERPLTAYLQWALHVVRLRAQAGERVRVVLAEDLGSLEAEVGRIPELLIMGRRVGYVVDYGENGIARGARRFDDPAVIDRCTALLADLHARGEDLEPFFQREVATLPPPVSPTT
ncbi:MAG: hypothetical protein HKP61_01105 [Dactylosporangium sp.]|nr:hypothetical protein [Dactylosporangium sp.]NNJ59568.1 hypothetical protein [Dactylosporangium sp.]